MIDLINQKETDYFLPEDGDISHDKFMELMSMPTETWVSGYGFNMKSVFELMKANDSKGVPYHLLLDYVQSQGTTAKPLLKDFNETKTVSDITLTTAGIGSKRTSQIWHWKGIVKAANDGGEPWCWEGSVNFSDSGWTQGNSCRVFRSQVWADVFRDQHAKHKAWAIENHPCYQATILEVGGEIDAYFDALSEGLDNETVQAALADPSLITPELALQALQEIAKLRGLN